MPAKLNKRINKILRDFEMAEGMVPGVIKYKFRDESSPEFYLVIVPNKNYDPVRREGKDNKKFFVFATNIKFNSVKEFTDKVPKEYRKRWNIETGYRMKKVFKIRTCSKSFAVRSLFFTLQCIMHNCLNVLKEVVSITAYTLKSAICEGIRNCLHIGSDLIRNQSIAGLYNRVKRYNEDRELQSRQQPRSGLTSASGSDRIFNLPNSGAMIRFDSDRLSGINLVALSHTFKVQINIYYMF